MLSSKNRAEVIYFVLVLNGVVFLPKWERVLRNQTLIRRTVKFSIIPQFSSVCERRR